MNSVLPGKAVTGIDPAELAALERTRVHHVRSQAVGLGLSALDRYLAAELD